MSEPTMIQVEESILRNALRAIEDGAEYCRELIARYDAEMGRNHPSTKRAGEGMDKDLDFMREAFENLKASLP